ncbi:MAG: HD domain-containing protein [Roseiflexaceae bacterium]
MISSSIDWTGWEARFEQFLLSDTLTHDAAHDLEHIRRVVATAKALARAEQADLAVVIPAAWLHDCVIVPKDSPLRSQASGLAAQAALGFLRTSGYPESHLDAIHHAIEAHSFSANIPPRGCAAQVVQDADRLDALGAIGVARCLMLGGAIGRRLYDPHEPFPIARALDDAINTVDHFYLKLLRLADTMTTPAGRAEAQRRTVFMCQFLEQLRSEIMPI